MPEGPEVTLLSQYLSTNLIDKMMTHVDVYSDNSVKNLEMFDDDAQYKITQINSKGKLLWFTLSGNETIYMTSHLGLTGMWSIQKPTYKMTKFDRVKIFIFDKKTNKFEFLIYNDKLNFGGIDFYDNKKSFNEKINSLAMDALKHDFTNKEFVKMVESFVNKSNSRKMQPIYKVLMKQNAADGLLSGLGNYLVAEILYHAKCAPQREIGSLLYGELIALAESIKYVTKLSYFSNTTDYMENFDEFIKEHIDGLKSGKYENYHPDIKFKNEKFEYNVYQQKHDPLGNPVLTDKTLQSGRTVHWVKEVQK